MNKALPGRMDKVEQQAVRDSTTINPRSHTFEHRGISLPSSPQQPTQSADSANQVRDQLGIQDFNSQAAAASATHHGQGQLPRHQPLNQGLDPITHTRDNLGQLLDRCDIIIPSIQMLRGNPGISEAVNNLLAKKATPKSKFRLSPSLHKSLEKLLHMGSLYCTKIIDKTSNKFWVDILYNWKRLLHNLKGSAQSCFTCPLWYNPNISKETLFLPQCYSREGNMLTLEEARKNYPVNLHFLDYYRLQSGIEKFKKTQGANSHFFLPEKPIWLATPSLIHKSKRGCKDFYDVLRQKKVVYYIKIGTATSNQFRTQRMAIYTFNML